MSGIKVSLDILNQKGTPAFFSDVFANRPAAGFAGRVFISTDTGAIYEDTGSTWTLIADAGAGTTGTLQQVTTNGNTTNQGIRVTANGIQADTLIIKQSGGTANYIGIETANNSYSLPSGTGISASGSNQMVFGFNGTVFILDSSTITTGQTRTYKMPDYNGTLAIGNPTTGYSILPNSNFINTVFYSGLTNPSESHIYNIGLVGTSKADSTNVNQWGIGVYGAGYTNGGTRSAGVQGDGEVTASADTGSAIGVRGYATATHAGGLNIGILGDASGSGTGNYGFYTNMASSANTFANYHLGTAPSLFGGSVGIGGVPSAYSNFIYFDLIGPTNVQGGILQSRSSDNSKIGSFFCNTNGLNIRSETNIPLLLGINGGEAMRIATSNNILIGTTSDNGQKLQVIGSGYFSSLGTGLLYSNGGVLTSTNPSDQRLKINIKDINWGLDEILKLRPVSYFWKNDNINQGVQFGFIAQEVQEIMPESIKSINDKFLGLEKDAIYSTLVKAIQEINDKLVKNNIN